MKIKDKIFYIGVFTISLIASIKYPSWVLDGLFDEAIIPAIGTGVACYGALIGVSVMYYKNRCKK
jgi:hypothetical protein